METDVIVPWWGWLRVTCAILALCHLAIPWHWTPVVQWQPALWPLHYIPSPLPYFPSSASWCYSQIGFWHSQLCFRGCFWKNPICAYSSCMHTPRARTCTSVTCTSLRSNPKANWGINVSSIHEHNWTGPCLRSGSTRIWLRGWWLLERMKSVCPSSTSLVTPPPPSQVCSPPHCTGK